MVFDAQFVTTIRNATEQVVPQDCGRRACSTRDQLR